MAVEVLGQTRDKVGAMDDDEFRAFLTNAIFAQPWIPKLYSNLEKKVDKIKGDLDKVQGEINSWQPSSSDASIARVEEGMKRLASLESQVKAIDGKLKEDDPSSSSSKRACGYNSPFGANADLEAKVTAPYEHMEKIQAFLEESCGQSEAEEVKPNCTFCLYYPEICHRADDFYLHCEKDALPLACVKSLLGECSGKGCSLMHPNTPGHVKTKILEHHKKLQNVSGKVKKGWRKGNSTWGASPTLSSVPNFSNVRKAFGV